MKLNRIFMMAGAAGSAATMILCSGASGAYTGLSVSLHTTVDAGGGPKSVYRVYATFTQANDVLFGWGGPSSNPMMIQSLNPFGSGPGSDFYNPGGLSAGPTAPTLEQINGGSKTPAIPGIQWGTFATVGVNIADQGSGPTPDFPNVDQTTVSPGFPNFIAGNSLTAAGVVFAVPQGTTGQGSAGYAADGDLELRVLMMQLTVNLGDHVSGEVDIYVQLGGSGQTTTLANQFFGPIPTPGALTVLGLAAMAGRRRRRG